MKLEDIAKKAGVSRSTVSRVINKEPYVSEKTRQRVLAVIEQEGFSPNAAARALVTQRTHIIGVVIPGNIDVFFTDNSYYPMLLQGIAVAAHERDFAILLWLGQSHDDREHFTRKVLGNRQMDGMVIASLQSDHPLIAMLPDIKIPLVTVDRPEIFDDQISYVTIDNVRAAVDAVSHLVSIGRRRIAHITGHLTITDGQDRLLGYRKALEQAGLPFDTSLIHHGNFSYEQGYEGMKRLLLQRPDALFAAGDTIAMGALQALQEAGLHVPDDVAVVGFDDLNETIDSKPPLTTVRQPVQQKGAQAAHLLIDLIEGKRVGPHQVLLPTELIVRQSTLPAYPTFQPHYKGGEVQQQI